MKISKLSVNLKRTNRIDFFVDGQYAGTLSQAVVAEQGVYQGKEITEAELNEILTSEAVYTLKIRAIELILKRPRSEREIRDYLNKKNVYKNLADEIIEQIVTELKAKKYVDDDAFTVWWIDNRNQFKGRSRAELRNELYRKGVAKDTIEMHLQGQEVNEREVLKDLVAKKSLAGKDLSPIKKKQKLIEYLLRKGFTWDDIKQQLE